MSLTIYKYEIERPTNDTFQLDIPVAAEILTVQTQRGYPHMWVLLDPDKTVVARHFRVFQTGQPIDEPKEALKYIDTFQLEYDTLVYHLFELDALMVAKKLPDVELKAFEVKLKAPSGEIMTNVVIRIQQALKEARGNGYDGAHHKTYAIDQMVRALTGCPVIQKQAIDYEGNPYTFEAMGESAEYLAWVAAYRAGEYGPDSYSWETGIAP